MDECAELGKCSEVTETQQLNDPREEISSQVLFDSLIITDIHSPENDQTWLYYREGTNPDERVDLTEYLSVNYKAIDCYQLYRKLQSADEGGGSETTEYLRERMSSTNELNDVTFNYGQAYQNIFIQPKIADLKVEVALDNDDQELAHSRKIDAPICTDGGILLVNDDRKEENTSYIFSNQKISKINEATPQKSNNSDAISSTAKLDTPPAKLNHTWTSGDREDNSNTSDNNLFSPSLVSTPVKTKVNDVPLNNNNEPDNLNSNFTFTSALEEPINNTYTKTWDEKLNILSQSDPAILETLENIREKIMVGTFSKSVSVKEQLCSIKFREGNSLGSEGNLNISEVLNFGKVTNDVESHSNSNSSSSSHIRSLDDVRTAARQQEESLQSFESQNIYQLAQKANKNKESINIVQQLPVRSSSYDSDNVEMKLKMRKNSGKIIEKKQTAQGRSKNIGYQSASVDNPCNVIRSSEKTKRDEGRTSERKPTGIFKAPLRFSALSQVQTGSLIQSKSEENCSQIGSEKLASTFTVNKDIRPSGDASSSANIKAHQPPDYSSNSLRLKSKIPRPSNGIKSKVIPH